MRATIPSALMGAIQHLKVPYVPVLLATKLMGPTAMVN
jgi:hypothetical protein